MVSKKQRLPSNCKIKAAIREIFEDFLNDPLVKGIGPTLMGEKVEPMKGIRLGKDTLQKMMIEAYSHNLINTIGHF